MLTKTMEAKLNEQVALEFYSSNLYLQMSSWCHSRGLEGCAAFLRDHAEEERGHMMRIFDYINETGAMAVLSSIDKPGFEYADVKAVFEATYAHEQLVTRAINDLVAAAFEERDFSTFNFLQWYVAEQHEEENLFKGILDKATLIGMEGRGMYHFDAEIKQLIGQAAPKAEAE